MFICDKIDFKITRVTREKDGQFIMIKEMLHQEYIIHLNIYAFNQGAPKYIKLIITELKKEPDKNIIIVGDLNTLLTSLH